MDTRHWIKSAERQGWKVSAVQGLTITLICSKQGCSGSITAPMENLGQTPEPCAQPHFGQYAGSVYDSYRELVAELVRRRRALGLSQDDVGAASGLADGHVNKLEAFARTAQMPTWQLWAETLGLQMSLQPAAMPTATIAAIERRPAPLREANTSKPRATASIGEHHDIHAAE